MADNFDINTGEFYSGYIELGIIGSDINDFCSKIYSIDSGLLSTLDCGNVFANIKSNVMTMQNNIANLYDRMTSLKSSLERMDSSNAMLFKYISETYSIDFGDFNSYSEDILENAKIEWLYDGNGVPTTKEENDKYLETFPVEYNFIDGNRYTMEITMHKKLKDDVQAIFKEIADKGFVIKGGGIAIRDWGSDGGYNGSFSESAHCYGHAFDINPNENCFINRDGIMVTGKLYEPGVNKYSVTDDIVEIWKKHGFYWGGDWKTMKDYMHFSYFNH